MARRTRIIGLTGGIGMGKSTVAAQLRRMGAHICNADAIVHRLMGPKGRAVEDIKILFPGVVKHDQVDRKALGDIVFKDPLAMAQLEHLLHPLVIEEENRFIARAKRFGAPLVVLDIPLLFETGGQARCDLVLVASAPTFIQRQRVMARPHMTQAKFARILALQMPDREKRRRADAVIQTGQGKAATFRQLATLVKQL